MVGKLVHKNRKISGRNRSRYYPGTCLQGLGKITVRMVSVLFEIRTEYLPNTALEPLQLYQPHQPHLCCQIYITCMTWIAYFSIISTSQKFYFFATINVYYQLVLYWLKWPSSMDCLQTKQIYLYSTE